MNSLIVFSLVVVALSSNCPRLQCTYKESRNCLTISNNVFTHWNCESDSSCPNYNLSSTSSLSCAPGSVPRPSKLDCFDYRSLNESCSAVDDLDTSKARPCALPFYCDKTQGKCLKKVEAGESCLSSQSCEPGYVCSSGKCIGLFSVQAGEKASNSLACESGIILNKLCQVSSLTVGEIPKACNDDEDCTASDGQKGECVCAYDSYGSSYCKLHSSDPQILDWKRALSDGALAHAFAFLQSVSIFPILTGTPQCFWEESLEAQDFLRAARRVFDCPEDGSASYNFDKYFQI